MAEPKVKVQESWRPEGTPEPDIAETPAARIRAHLAKLSDSDVVIVRRMLLETAHTFPSGERALTAVLSELGLEKRETKKE